MTKQSHSKHNPWFWIPSLFAAEEIPSVMILYVALLLIFQLGMGCTLSTLLTALLLLPWTLRSFFRAKVKRMGNYRAWLHAVEFAQFLLFAATAFYMSGRDPRPWVVYAFLFLISVLCAWHQLLSIMYYERMLYPREQKIYLRTRRLTSLLTTVFTYGLLIMFVGFVEIFLRSMRHAWAMGNYLLAGGVLVVFILNVLVLRQPRVAQDPQPFPLRHSLQSEATILRRAVGSKTSVFLLLTAFLMLLPQALLFAPRVFFLMASSESGGLNCSLQDVGFAQGTIGAVAFGVGTLLGSYFRRHTPFPQLFRPLGIALSLSPVFYLLMAFSPQRENMFALCLMTGASQFCFGLGLNVFAPFIRYFSHERYRNATSSLYVPLVLVAMLPPLALSGFLMKHLGFQAYFLADALATFLACALVMALGHRILRLLAAPQSRIQTKQKPQ